MTGKGLFITLEGGEGAGKTTQVALLARALEERGHEVVATREPGGTEGAEALRRLLLGSHDFSWKTQALILFAARQDHMDKIIRPALEAGKTVICDRFHASTLAYQGYGLAEGEPDVLSWLEYQRKLSGLEADFSFLLDLPLEEAFARRLKRRKKADYFELKDRAFHRRVREGFLKLAKERDQMAIIQAGKAKEEVLGEILAVLENRRPGNVKSQA